LEKLAWKREWNEMRLMDANADHIVCGAINWDTTIFVQKFPMEGEEVRVERVIDVPGGKGANIAVASARVLGKGRVALFGSLGTDHIAARQIDILRAEGVITGFIRRDREVQSGQAFILVDSAGRNSILTFKKANDVLTESMAASSKLTRAIRHSKLVTIIDPPLEVAGRLVRTAAEHGRQVIWSPGMLSRWGIRKRKMADIIRQLDFLVLNEQECSSLLSMPCSSAADAVHACRLIIKVAARKELGVIVTMGEKGCLMAKNGELVIMPRVDLGMMGLRVVNTVGAGDAFIGTFSAMKVLGRDDSDALFMANLSGSIKTTRQETRRAPTLAELVRIGGKVKREYRTRKL
jgi:ribokinase